MSIIGEEDGPPMKVGWPSWTSPPAFLPAPPFWPPFTTGEDRRRTTHRYGPSGRPGSLAGQPGQQLPGLREDSREWATPTPTSFLRTFKAKDGIYLALGVGNDTSGRSSAESPGSSISWTTPVRHQPQTSGKSKDPRSLLQEVFLQKTPGSGSSSSEKPRSPSVHQHHRPGLRRSQFYPGKCWWRWNIPRSES